jgi:hypothetical protein
MGFIHKSPALGTWDYTGEGLGPKTAAQEKGVHNGALSQSPHVSF